MSVYNLIILCGAASAALVAWGYWRYVGWIAALTASYAMSVLYWDIGGSYAEFFAGICDLTIVGLVAWRARFYWELWFGGLLLVSAFVNMAYLAINLGGALLFDHVIYSSILEIINFAAIMLIGGTAAFDKAGFADGLAFRPWMHIFGFVRPVHQRRDPRP